MNVIVVATLFVGSSAMSRCNCSQGENGEKRDECRDLFQLSSYLHWRKGKAGSYCATKNIIAVAFNETFYKSNMLY